MKRRMLLFGLLLAVGDVVGQPTLYVHAGPAVTLGPNQFVDFWGTGYTLGGEAGWRLTSVFEVVAGVSFRRFPFEKEEFLDEAGVIGIDLAVEGGALSVASGMLGLKLNLEASKYFAPYLVAGVGVHRRTFSAFDLFVAGEPAARLATEKDTALGFSLGAGLGWILSDRLQVYIEPSYTLVRVRPLTQVLPGSLVDADNTRFMPLKMGVALSL